MEEKEKLVPMTVLELTLKTLHGKEVLADEENKNTFAYDTEEEKEETNRFLNQMENEENE